jgi:hypothetical protein
LLEHKGGPAEQADAHERQPTHVKTAFQPTLGFPARFHIHHFFHNNSQLEYVSLRRRRTAQEQKEAIIMSHQPTNCQGEGVRHDGSVA